MDVAWSPTHPAMFACADATGRVDLWNLNQVFFDLQKHKSLK